jgi:hypothetical protein
MGTLPFSIILICIETILLSIIIENVNTQLLMYANTICSKQCNHARIDTIMNNSIIRFGIEMKTINSYGRISKELIELKKTLRFIDSYVFVGHMIVILAMIPFGSLILSLFWYDDESLNIRIIMISMLSSFMIATISYFVQCSSGTNDSCKLVGVLTLSLMSLIGICFSYCFGFYLISTKSEPRGIVEYIVIWGIVATFIASVRVISCYLYLLQFNKSKELDSIEMSSLLYCNFISNRDQNQNQSQNADQNQSQNADQNDECSICLIKYGNQDKITVLGCDHYFHYLCIMVWIQDYNNNTCPYCRVTIAKLYT